MAEDKCWLFLHIWLFSWYKDGEIKGIICLYVDDFLWAGEEQFKRDVVDNLSDMFLIGSSASKAFKYIGLNIESKPTGETTIDQFQYIQNLKMVQISKEKSNSKSSEWFDRQRSDYRSLIGQLNWISTHTRPDISFGIS